MKGSKLLITVLLSAGIIFSLLLFNYSSWSAADGSVLEPFLKLTLSTIILSLWSVSYTHDLGNKIMFTNTWLKTIRIRLKHLDRITALLFVGVLAFGMAGPWWSKVLHYIFILGAAAGMFIRVVRYYDNYKRIIGIIGISAAAAVWLVGFIWPGMWSVGVGEMVFYLISGFSIIAQLDKINDTI